ncbi:hypothetical protein Nepgr_009744 [Nepenthes gracilis]|uniref:NPH3 domain-containing protein n=1 Tax=Nepenthes gracilis TaxID=150966 RepID=A0AAD3XKM6_NEPGR|nr:hypothetical protein Nepgr_009744 [Nepenthes gracilis]
MKYRLPLIETKMFAIPLSEQLQFPLLSRSSVLEKLLGETFSEDGKTSILQLHDIPGGAKIFLLVAKFCYGVSIELNALNIVSLRCAAEYFQMNENYGEKNLILRTEDFLDEVFGSWTDSLKALQSCEEVLPHAEELHIVSRCINSLATKACADPSLFILPVSGEIAATSTGGTFLWNGIQTSSKPQSSCDDWWYNDVSFLKLPFYKRLIQAAELRGMKVERIAGSIMFYARKYLPMMGRQSGLQNGYHLASASTDSSLSDVDQSNLLEEIVEILPDRKGVVPTKFLLRLLRTSVILRASPSCRETLEKRIGAQLDEAALEDVLIPNMGYSAETLYDIDCVQRILDHFMMFDQDFNDYTSCNLGNNEMQLSGGSHSLMPVTVVANLVDGYLAEVASDVNLKLPKFQSLAAAIPDYARPLDDGIYCAIDTYLKAHPWLTDYEKEHICQLLNCQKLSVEASMHAAQNERLPLRVIVQVLFFEQLHLRTSIASWFWVSDNLESSQNLSSNIPQSRNDCSAQLGCIQDQIVAADEMRERVHKLEKECSSMKQELDKLVKHKRSWILFLKKLGLRLKSRQSDHKASKLFRPTAAAAATNLATEVDNGKQSHGRGEWVD